MITVASRCAIAIVVRPAHRSPMPAAHAAPIRIERGGCLVKQNDRRVTDQGARDGDALTLPAGKLHPVSPTWVS